MSIELRVYLSENRLNSKEECLVPAEFCLQSGYGYIYLHKQIIERIKIELFIVLQML